MAGCRATKADGGACKGDATGPNGLCWAHDPSNATQRKRAAAKGGKSKPNREVKGYKQEVRALIAEVKSGVQDRADASVMLQGYRVLKDFAELERRVREQDDLEARIEQLERAGGDAKGGSRWAT